MRIGIDTFGCAHGRSGAGIYLFSLIKNLPESDGDEIELFGIETDRFVYNSPKREVAFTGLHIPDSPVPERLWHAFFLNRFVRRQKYDVVLYPAFLSMLPCPKHKAVFVIHELLSQVLKKNDSPLFRRYLKKCLKRAAKIITPSLCVKKELVAFGVKSDKIEVVHNGVDHSLFYPRPTVDGDFVTIKPFAIKKPFVIYPSTIQYPEKKHVELIRAFSLFKKKTASPCRLVLAGSEGANAALVQKEVLRSPYASEIVLTGHFPYQNLPELYASSEACIVPSVSEGFGLPVLEAMASGIPVLCAKAGALSEIAGPDALYFNPDNIEEMASGLEKVLCEDASREKMLNANREWVSRFSWKKTATKTLDVIRAILSETAQ